MANQGYLPPDLMAEQAGIERRRRLAEALTSQGMQSGRGVQAGRFYVPQSPLEPLVRAFSAFAGAKAGEDADKASLNLAKQAGDRRVAALTSALNPKPTTSVAPTDAEGTGSFDMSGMSGPTVTTTQPGPAYGPLLASQDPMLQQLGGQLMLQAEKPKEGFTLAPGATRFDAQGRTVASGAPAEDEFTKALKAAGMQPNTPEWDRLMGERVKKLTTHPPAADVKVDVKTGEGLAKEIGPMVAESRTSALGALDAVDTANRVNKAISAGNVTLGPGATVRNTVDQLAQTMGVAGKDTTERLTNTREVIRGLAQFTIAARKQLKGQGQVSDFEGKLLQKAESGAIDDMTLPELQAFVAMTDRLARRQYELHGRNLEAMRGRSDLQSLLPFYEVPQMPESAFKVPAQAPTAPDGGLSPAERQELEQLRKRFGRR